MSNRTLMEFNHDYAGQIEKNPDRFMLALNSYLNSADWGNAEELRMFGINVIEMRHHSGSYKMIKNKVPVTE